MGALLKPAVPGVSVNCPPVKRGFIVMDRPSFTLSTGHAPPLITAREGVSAEAALGPLAAVGPFRVTPSSRGPLIVSFAVALAVIGLLAALLLTALRKRP